MDKIISLQDTSMCLKEQKSSIDKLIEALSKQDNRLRSYMVLQMLVSKAECTLSQMKEEIPDIEKRLKDETESICKHAEEVIAGLKTHSNWFKDVLDTLGDLYGDKDLETRHSELHGQIEEMEKALNKLVEKRNECPLSQL